MEALRIILNIGIIIVDGIIIYLILKRWKKGGE